MKRGFVSDNCAPVHPKIMEAVIECNAGHQASYGEDVYCERAKAAFAKLFEQEMPVLCVFNGTGANILSLACMVRPSETVLCADCAHINADETGAPERMLGVKLQAIHSSDGKLSIDQIAPLLHIRGNQHHAQPRVISITNVTEWGAVYTPDEVRMLADFAHENGMLLHMDGARIANAVVSCGCTMADMTWKAGVDVLSFGGAKNGLMFGEAVLFFRQELAKSALFVRKNVTQLHSKSRYLGAQFEALIKDGQWKKNAEHANYMAKKLEAAIRGLPFVEIVHPANANMLFLYLSEADADRVCAAGYGANLGGIIRMVTAWDTQEEDINALTALLCQDIE